MATWNVGPFDNDDAVEWCANLEALEPGQRAALVRRTLEEAEAGGPDLAEAAAAEAIAAAAAVLQSLTGVQVSDSFYAPRFLLGRGDIDVTPELRALAVRALDAVFVRGSTWRLCWADDVEEEEVLAVIEELRAKLAPTNP